MLKRRRREKARQQPFPLEWTAILERNVPIYRRLTEEDRRELHGHVRVLLAEKNFEGCGGLEMTDEIRLTVAAQAAVLLLHRETDYYPGLYSVLVYPSSFWATGIEHAEGGLVLEGEDVRAGESWHQGAIVLAWDEVLVGGAHYNDGYNVVYHEFAHQLDRENPDGDGLPVLPTADLYSRWHEVFTREYERLVRDVDAGRPTVLDDYAAEDPAEYFAVATECFFEKPLRLRKNHPDLYDLLKAYYCQDPAGLFGGR